MPIVEDFPTIDPSVKHVGVSKLRGLNADKLRENTDTYVIQDNEQPLAVLLTYDKFLAMQEKLRAINRVDRDTGSSFGLSADSAIDAFFV